MRVMFPKILDILFIISVSGVVIAAYSAGAASYKFSFAIFIPMLLIGLVSATMAFGIIYVLLDIRDALQQGRRTE